MWKVTRLLRLPASMAIGQLGVLLVGLLGLLCLCFYALVQQRNSLQDPLSAGVLSDLLLRDQVDFLMDFRSDLDREENGYIEDSQLIAPDRSNIPLGKSGKLAVFLASDPDKTDDIRQVLKSHGHAEVLGYLDGVEKLPKIKGSPVHYPKFISYKALKHSLGEGSILLMDVRNRSELNEAGQIPGSVCLPLHEVEHAFDGSLDSKQFLQKYHFEKPDPDARNVILSCKSGRRASTADKIMKRFGYQNLRIYSGSYSDWVANNGATVKGAYGLDYK